MPLLLSSFTVGNTAVTVYTATASAVVGFRAVSTPETPVVVTQFRAGAVVSTTNVSASNPNPSSFNVQNGDVLQAICLYGDALLKVLETT